MKRIKGYTASETKQVEAFVAANRKDTRTWQERVLANEPAHLRAEIAAAMAALVENK